MVRKTKELSRASVMRAKRRQRGSAMLMALMYTTLFGALAASMTLFTSSSLEVTAGNERSSRAFATAESGMAFLNLQLKNLAKPIVSQGTIDNTLARTLFSGSGGITSKLTTQLNGTTNLQGKTIISNATTIRIPPIKLYSSVDDSQFCLQIDQDAADPHILHYTSTGMTSGIMRSVTMDAVIEKKLKYAIYSNVAIQIGKNAVVEGDVVSTLTNFAKGPPVWMLEDFRALSNMSSFDTHLDQFRAMLHTHDVAGTKIDTGFNNRIDLNSPNLTAADLVALYNMKAVDRQDSGLKDVNGNTIYTYQSKSGDTVVDDWDMALGHLDTNGDKALSTGEFLDPATGTSRDAELFYMIDTINPDRNGVTGSGYNDGVLDARDSYAKVKGSVKVGVTQSAWEAWANDSTSSGGAKYGVGFREQFQGPIINPDPTVPPAQFGIDQTDVPVIVPWTTASDGHTPVASQFDTSGYFSQTGTSNGSTTGSVASGTISNVTLTSAMANGTTSGHTVVEQTPYGSTSWQATYQRPVFQNVTFQNVRIPKGLNAKFVNCTFKGVTYVDMTTTITNSAGNPTTDPNDGMTWSKKMVSGTFSNTLTLTAANSQGFQNGNNLHFDNCTFNGPIAAANPTAYTHFTNSWEFTGATKFDNQVDPTATILAPNTNIEMGSFSDPNAAPSTMVGVVVAGNIDIRGRSVVDGSIIVTGNGAGNTTLAYFGASDSTSDPTAMPEGGYGRLYMRYNAARSMPNGISIPILLTPSTGTYSSANVAVWPW